MNGWSVTFRQRHSDWSKNSNIVHFSIFHSSPDKCWNLIFFQMNPCAVTLLMRWEVLECSGGTFIFIFLTTCNQLLQVQAWWYWDYNLHAYFLHIFEQSNSLCILDSFSEQMETATGNYQQVITTASAQQWLTDPGSAGQADIHL